MKDILKYRDFTGSVHYNDEDEVFFGKIIGIDDLITFEGNSVASLKKAFKDAVEDYLSICRETGKEPLKSFKGSFNVRIDPELHKVAAMKSSELGVSLNQLVADAIAGFLTKTNVTENTRKAIQVKENGGKYKPRRSKT
jgi:predicted HicB family RNase H-like nuclease